MPPLAFTIMQRILFSRVMNLFKITIPRIAYSERLGWRFQKWSSRPPKSTIWVPNQPPNSNRFFFVPWWLICHVLRSDSHETQMPRRNCVRNSVTTRRSQICHMWCLHTAQEIQMSTAVLSWSNLQLPASDGSLLWYSLLFPVSDSSPCLTCGVLLLMALSFLV